MAKQEWTLNEGFDDLLAVIERGVLDGSMSASLEDGSDFSRGGARCAVRVFERYSWTGGNRLSLTVTLFQAGGPVHVSAITGGGSQAVFFKLNTVGEDAFLDALAEVLARYE